MLKSLLNKPWTLLIKSAFFTVALHISQCKIFVNIYFQFKFFYKWGARRDTSLIYWLILRTYSWIITLLTYIWSSWKYLLLLLLRDKRLLHLTIFLLLVEWVWECCERLTLGLSNWIHEIWSSELGVLELLRRRLHRGHHYWIILIIRLCIVKWLLSVITLWDLRISAIDLIHLIVWAIAIGIGLICIILNSLKRLLHLYRTPHYLKRLLHKHIWIWISVRGS